MKEEKKNLTKFENKWKSSSPLIYSITASSSFEDSKSKQAGGGCIS